VAGLSQQKLALSAGVSQSALSRYETSPSSTPMLVVMKVNVALRREIARGRLPRSMQESRRLMSLEGRGIPRTVEAFDTFRVTVTPDLETLTRLFWIVPARHRSRFVDVLRWLAGLTRATSRTPQGGRACGEPARMHRRAARSPGERKSAGVA
jgi:hypothetical protein